MKKNRPCWPRLTEQKTNLKSGSKNTKKSTQKNAYIASSFGGICLHMGAIAEMKTGEGKTLVATLPVYLNGLTGKGVHVVTVNDYLAQRDADWMGQIHRWLGLTVGLIIPDDSTS